MLFVKGVSNVLTMSHCAHSKTKKTETPMKRYQRLVLACAVVHNAVEINQNIVGEPDNEIVSRPPEE